jgi:outer membrane protein
MKLKIWLLATLLPMATSLLAQKKIYTLEEVWQKVLLYPSVTSKEELVRRQQALKQLVQQQSMPEVQVQAQQTYGSYASVPGSFFPLQGIYNTSGTKQSNAAFYGSNMYASALLQWDFVQFGRQQKEIAVADSRIKLSQAAVSQEAFRLQSISTRYYFGALESSTLLTHFTADAKRLSNLLNLQRAQADAGLRPGADTLLVKAGYLDAISRVANQQAILASLREQLSALTGEAGYNFGFDTTIYQRFTESTYLEGSPKSTHPYLVYLDAAIQQYNAELAAVEKEPYPSIGLLAGTGIRGSGLELDGDINKSITAPWTNNNSSYLVGLGITWKFSSLYNNRQKRKAVVHQMEAAKLEYEAADRQLRAAYAAALESWKEQKLKVQNARLSLQASQQAYDLYTVRYESGLISLIELLQLQKSLQDAEINYVRSVSSFWNSLIEQSEAFGDPSLLLTAIKP